MSKVITSKIIGQLIQDEKFQDWWKSEEIPIPFFDNEKLSIVYMDYEPDNDENFIYEADEALNNFLKLGQKDRLNVSKYVYGNLKDFIISVGLNDVDTELRNLKDDKQIWNYVDPMEIYVTRRPYNDKEVYIQISLNCDWEEEHGLQLVFRKGKKLTRVSDIDGHLTDADAYGKSDEEDKLLSEFYND
jgi:hypothetical protein